MYRWGHIQCFRFDNGRPFGDPTGQVLTPCALNLIARGCDVIFNPRRKPTSNAKVERCQGTTGRWSDPCRSANIKDFSQNLDYAVIAQRQRLHSRVCQGFTRAQYYPALFTNSHKYNPQDFDLRRVFKYLSKGKWYRTVSAVGQIEMFGIRYQLGLKYRNQVVLITLQIQDQMPYWFCFDQNQNLIEKIYAQNMADGSFLDLSNKSKN